MCSTHDNVGYVVDRVQTANTTPHLRLLRVIDDGAAGIPSVGLYCRNHVCDG